MGTEGVEEGVEEGGGSNTATRRNHSMSSKHSASQ